MGAEVVRHVLEADFQVVQQGDLRPGLVVERDRLLQDAEIAGFPDIGNRTEDKPQRVVVETAADVVVAPLGQGLVLMVAAAIRELRGGNVDDPLPRPLRDEMDDAGEVLVGIAEAHAPADAALEIAGAPAEEEGDHALVLVPDVHGPVQLRHVRFHGETPQEVVPVGFQGCEGRIDLLRSGERIHHRLRLGLVDHGGGDELLLGRILHIPEDENQFRGLPRFQRQVEPVRGDGAPAMGHGVPGSAGEDLLRRLESVVHADEGFPVRVEPVEGTVHAEEGVMVAAFAVFGLVIEDVPIDLHLARGEVPLEILHVGGSVPEAPFHEGIELEGLFRRTRVHEFHPVHFAAVADGHEEKDIGLQPVLLPRHPGIAHAVAALIGVEGGLAGLPARIPDRVAILDVVIAAAGVHGYAVVAVAEDPAEFGVLAEAVTACGIGNQGEEILRPHVVDPRPRGGRIRDDVLPVGVVEMSVFFHMLWLHQSFQK